jgi:putative FmdB family regulatory protein
MPMYDFSCTNPSCLAYHEAIVPFDTELHPCPQCGQLAQHIMLAPGSKYTTKAYFNWMAP